MIYVKHIEKIIQNQLQKCAYLCWTERNEAEVLSGCMTHICFTAWLHFVLFSASSIGRYVKKKLSEVDIWFGPYIKIHEALRSAITVCETWISACESLTLHLWKRYSPHPWKGNKFVPKHLQQLAQRIEEVNQ